MFKHYLCCLALVLGVSAPAYATKGGSLGTHAQKKIKSIAAALKWYALHTTAVAAFSLTLICGGITGCDNGGDTLTETGQVAEVTDRYVGDDVYFEIGGEFYEGHVVEGVSESEVRIFMPDSGDTVVSLDRIGGYLLVGHSDEGTRVVLLGEQEDETELAGTIIAVYSDDMRKIKITAVAYLDGKMEKLDPPRIRFVHKDTDIRDGGYLTPEEFRELLKELME